MDIYLLIEGQRLGPYTEQHVRRTLFTEQIQPTTQAWHDGLTEWVTVQSLLESNLVEPSSPVIHPVTKPILTPPPHHLLKTGNKKTVVRSIGLGAFVLAAIAMFGISIGYGIGLANSHFNPVRSPERMTTISSSVNPSATPHSRVWFKVYEPEQYSSTEWCGFLYSESTDTSTQIIVDFGRSLKLGKDDRLEGKYIPTSETGIWNGNPVRVYRLEGDFKFVDPLTVQ